MTEQSAAPWPLGRPGWTVVGLLLAGILAWSRLDLSIAQLAPREGGLRIARSFFSAALSPAFDYQASGVPEGAPPFFTRLFAVVGRTVLYAAAALSLALPMGLLLGYLASSSCWAADPMGPSSRWHGAAALWIRSVIRVGIACLRSVHELLWAVMFLAAMGLSPATGVLALAIPYSGLLAKVFSEVLDEVPDDTARGIRAVGATPFGVFLWGRLPRALPDMAAYAFYRFECAVRSSAVLGFFGFPTLGYYLRASFEDGQYREVWTFLYALLILVFLLEGWSAALRRRLVV